MDILSYIQSHELRTIEICDAKITQFLMMSRLCAKILIFIITVDVAVDMNITRPVTNLFEVQCPSSWYLVKYRHYVLSIS